MRKVQILVALLFVLIVAAVLKNESYAYPPFVAKARKFGAKDCTFCHVDPSGGQSWNERGQWLIKEKERRNADSVDPEWLVNYKANRSKKKR